MRGLTILTSLSVIISMFAIATEPSRAADPGSRPDLSASDKNKIQQMLNEDQPVKTPAKTGTNPGGTKKGSGAGTTTTPQSSGTAGKK